MVLKITLLSDLCSSSGEAFGYSIDSDITFDRDGFPYIPSRRLKGCLREAADELVACGYLSQTDVNSLFGTPGGSGGSLRLKNAVMDKPQELLALDKNEIIAKYTGIRSQTSLTEAGNADENSLRSTRVLNRFDPITKENITFTAEVRCDACDEKTLEIACNALRHIGLHRTRGLGVVSCKFDPSKAARDEKAVVDRLKGKYEKFGKVRLTYTVRLVSPITLPKHGGGIEKHISGSSVLGMFAGQYLKHISLDQKADAMFAELFLKNKVFWSPLYPAYQEGETYRTCYPAPLYLVKTKYTPEPDGTYKNIYAEKVEGQSQPKSLTGKYAVRTGDGYGFITPKTQSIYHHSRNNPLRADDLNSQELYVQKSICENQFFKGEIVAERAYIPCILNLLEAADIAFGRSRTAQYASCKLVDADIEEYKSEKISVRKGEKLYAVLKTDLLLVDEAGVFDVSSDAVTNALAKEIGNVKPIDCNCLYKTVTGFHAVWRLQKPAKPAVQAGSVYTFEVLADGEIEREMRLGENYREGFGQIEWIPEGQMKELKKIEEYDPAEPQQAGNKNDHRDKARAYFYEKKNVLLKNFKEPSFVGRLALMLKESREAGNVKEELKNRIESISSERKRKSAMEFLYDAFEGLDDAEFFESVYIVLSLLKYALRARKADKE